jgi:UDP-2-acetamido-2-deoxy-ribo-hexuluronate aminotransferase
VQFIDLATQQQRIREPLEQRIQAVLRHGHYILGPEVEELEERLAAIAGVSHCVGVANGTDAIQLALIALGVGPGDEVITPSFSYVAAAEMIEMVGATTVFVDVDPRTYNLDADLLEAAITPRTKAIIPVDLFGQCADYDRIEAVARRHGIAVIEDGAQSFGASYKGRPACSFGRIATTSFFPSKPLGGYGDGGACLTNDADLATVLRQLRAHGQGKRYHHLRLGMNSRLDTLQAAILLAKLDVFASEMTARNALGRRYTAMIGERLSPDEAAPPWVEPFNTSAFAQYTIAVEHRDRVAKSLSGAGIPTAIHYPLPVSRQPIFDHRSLPDFPVSDAAATRVISLPMHPYLDEHTQLRVVDALVLAVRGR